MLLNRLKSSTRYDPKKAYSRTGKRNFNYGQRIPRVIGGNAPAILRSSTSEIKTVDVQKTTSVISTTSTFTLLNGVQEGSAFYNRIGRKICMKSIRVSGSLQISGLGGNVPEYLRVLIVYDRQTNGAFPVISDILANYDNAGGTNAAGDTALAGLNMNNSERFYVLRDTRYYIANAEEGTGESNAVASIVDYQNKGNYDEYVKLGDLETTFKATTNPAVVGNIATGGLYLVTIGTVAVGTAGYGLVWNSRLRFKDT